MGGGDGGFVVGAFQPDAELGRSDRNALGSRAVLVGRIVAIADHILELIVELLTAAMLVLHCTAVEFVLGEDRTDTENTATGRERAVLRHRSDAVLALLAGVVAVLVQKVRDRIRWRRSRSAADTMSAGGIAGSACDDEGSALLQGRDIAITGLRDAHEGGCIVERVDADIDNGGYALTCLVGGVCSGIRNIGVGIAGTDYYALVIQRHDGEAVGVVLAAIVLVCKQTAVQLRLGHDEGDGLQYAAQIQIAPGRQHANVEADGIVCSEAVCAVAGVVVAILQGDVGRAARIDDNGAAFSELDHVGIDCRGRVVLRFDLDVERGNAARDAAI